MSNVLVVFILCCIHITCLHLCSSSQDWIYRQLLTLSEPLHPTLPSLMQEFVNSILLSAITPGPRGASGYGTNAASTKSHSPFTDEEVHNYYYIINIVGLFNMTNCHDLVKEGYFVTP